jgi:hypothetical protein
MAKTLAEILHYENLMGVVNAASNGVPADLLPPAFLSVGRQTVTGDRGVFTKISGTRKVARQALYGSPSQQRALSGVSKVPVTLIHAIDSINHDPNVLMMLSQYDNPALQSQGIAEIDRQGVEMRQLQDNLRVSALFSMLVNGTIWFDGNGGLLPSDSGAVVTVDFGVPAANKAQAGGAIAATWATAATDIIGHVTAIRKAARKATGFPLRHAFYGPKIINYLLANTALKEILVRNPAYQAALASGEIPDGVLGFVWHPIAEAFFEDMGGTNRDWSGDDTLILTPEPSAEWMGWLEGTYPVPTTINVASDAEAAARSVRPVAGRFTYAQVIADPVTVKQVSGDTFLPVLKVPAAVYQLDVTP